MEQRKKTDFMTLYHEWDELPNGAKAELRRAAKPEEMLKIPAFYRLYSGKSHAEEREKRAYQRLIFCLPHINNIDKDVSLGKALALGQCVSEKRLFQVVRSDYPNDIIQLRRILAMFKPKIHVNWEKAAKTLWHWDDRRKRDLLEDFFNQPQTP